MAMIPSLETEREMEREINPAVSPVVQSLPTKPETRSDTVARFLPWGLAFGMLSMLLSLIWFNQRLDRIEERLTNSKSDAAHMPMVTPMIEPIPSPSAPADEKSLVSPANSLPKPDLVDRSATKPLITIPSPAPLRNSKIRKAPGKAAPKVSRSPARAELPVQSNLTKPGVIPDKKRKSQSPGIAERPAKP